MQDGANLSEWGLKPFIYKERASLTAYRKEFKHKSELETKGKFILKAITLHRQESGLLSKLENEPLSIPGTGFKSVFLSGDRYVALKAWEVLVSNLSRNFSVSSLWSGLVLCRSARFQCLTARSRFWTQPGFIFTQFELPSCCLPILFKATIILTSSIVN